MDTEIVDTDEQLVTALLAEQFADLAHLSVTRLASGWDNVSYRVGDELVARLPRRAASAGLLANEQAWLAVIAPELPLPIPVPAHVGQPGCDYPFNWSLCPWLPGETSADAALDDPITEAGRLGRFLAALHRPAPPALESNPYRGVDLAVRQRIVDNNLVALDGQVDSALVREAFAQLCATPVWAGPALRLHGDLHSANVLVDHGEVSAVIDWGDVCSGDPACDLAVAWMLFGPEAREVFRRAAGCDANTWTRAAGWAIAFALVYMANEELSPAMAVIGRRLLPEVLGDL